MANSRKYRLHHGESGAALAVRITPRASRNEITGILDDGTVKIRITAPPVDGKANKTLIQFLSKVLGCPKSDIDIIGGLTGRDKLVTILNLNSDQVQQKIMKQFS